MRNWSSICLKMSFDILEHRLDNPMYEMDNLAKITVVV